MNAKIPAPGGETKPGDEPYVAYRMPHDRLGRYAVLGSSKGGGKPVIAVNIRTQAVAELLASAPVMRDKLTAIAMECNGAIATGFSPLAAAILAIIDPPRAVAVKK